MRLPSWFISFALEVDTNPITYYPASAPVAVTARAINEHFGGSTEIAVMVEGDIQDPAVMKQIDGLETELRKMPQVGFTTSIAQVVKTMRPLEHERVLGARLFQLFQILAGLVIEEARFRKAVELGNAAANRKSFATDEEVRSAFFRLGVKS
jgi:predicted RND superfamily exporter protein